MGWGNGVGDSGLHGLARDDAAVKGNASGSRVQGDELVAGGLIHEAIEILAWSILTILILSGVNVGGRLRRRMEIGEGDNLVALAKTVEERKEAVLAPRD